jgi:hypothetical protein
MSTLSYQLHNKNKTNCEENNDNNKKNKRGNNLNSSSESSERTQAKAHGSFSAIELLRDDMILAHQEFSGDSTRGTNNDDDVESSKQKMFMDSFRAENMFENRRSLDLEHVAIYGSIKIAPAVTNGYGNAPTLPRRVPSFRRVIVYDDDEDVENARSPGRKRRGACGSFLAMEAELLQNSDDGGVMHIDHN